MTTKKSVSTTKLIPLNNNLLIEQLKEEETTSFGFVINPMGDDKPNKFTVIAVGNNVDKSYGLTEGSVVYCSHYAGDAFKIGGKELRIVNIDSVLAKEV